MVPLKARFSSFHSETRWSATGEGDLREGKRILVFALGAWIQRRYGLIFEYNWAWALTAALIGFLGGAAGALYPALRAANLYPVEALAYE